MWSFWRWTQFKTPFFLVNRSYSKSQPYDFFKNIVSGHFRVSTLQIALIMPMLNVSDQCVQNLYYEFRIQKFSTALWIIDVYNGNNIDTCLIN